MHESKFDLYACEDDIHECNNDTNECDLYTDSVIYKRIFNLKGTNV
jgi:hypothetical protein